MKTEIQFTATIIVELKDSDITQEASVDRAMKILKEAGLSDIDIIECELVD